MEEEIKVETMDNDYLEQIKNLKESTVSKEEYNKLKEENKKLLNAYVNGEQQEKKEVAPVVATKELKEETYLKEINNLDYWNNVLELKDRCVKENHYDPMCPHGSKVSASVDDMKRSADVEALIRQCMDYAQGNPQLFTDRLNQLVPD